ADDQRYDRRFVSQADLGPEVVFPKAIAVVAGKNDDCIVGLPGPCERIEYLAYLRVNIGHRRVVATNRLLLATDVHLHVRAGLVVDAGLRDVVPIARNLRWKWQLVVRYKRLEIVLRRDE